MKANANQIRAALDAASPDIRLYLLHGPDEAGAADLALRLARALGPEAERVDLDGSALRSDPARLADEAASLSLFGGKRFIRVGAVGEESLPALTTLLEAETAGNPVVAIAPTVKSTAKIVKLAQGSARAMALACYVPDGADAERIATQIAREHGLRPVGGAARRLAEASGGDRAIMAREIEKLALYLDAAPDRPAELARLEQAGTSAIPVLRGLVRRLMALAEMRADVDAGASVGEVIERHRVFFKEKTSTTRALRVWSAAALDNAIDRARKAERGMMSADSAGQILADDAFVTIARIAARAR